jgi:hypothetical protein
MMLTRRFAALAAIGLLSTIPFAYTSAQGVTTGAIGGLVTDSTGVPLGQVQIQILNMQLRAGSRRPLSRDRATHRPAAADARQRVRVVVADDAR